MIKKPKWLKEVKQENGVMHYGPFDPYDKKYIFPKTPDIIEQVFDGLLYNIQRDLILMLAPMAMIHSKHPDGVPLVHYISFIHVMTKTHMKHDLLAYFMYVFDMFDLIDIAMLYDKKTKLDFPFAKVKTKELGEWLISNSKGILPDGFEGATREYEKDMLDQFGDFSQFVTPKHAAAH